MPAQNRVGCHECRDLCQQSTSETLADDGETTPLVLVKADASPTELRS